MGKGDEKEGEESRKGGGWGKGEGEEGRRRGRREMGRKRGGGGGRWGGGRGSERGRERQRRDAEGRDLFPTKRDFKAPWESCHHSCSWLPGPASRNDVSRSRFMNHRVPAHKRYQPTEYEHAANCATHAVS